MTTLFGYNGDGVRVGRTVGAAATNCLVDLAATLPVVISDTDAVYLYGLDIIAEQLAGADRYYYVHDGLGSARHPSARSCRLWAARTALSLVVLR